jgi:flagellar biosynthesis/type III secretory pathway chaperone
MTAQQSILQTYRSVADTPLTALRALADALRSEYRLLQELITVMQRQRAAVAADDLVTVEESVYSTHRVLHTLNEARRRRRSLNRLLGESDDLPIRELDAVLGPRMTDELRVARDELEEVARSLSGEVEINRRVLRRALATGDDFVKALYGGPEPAIGYAAGPSATQPDRRGGLLLNRTV